MTIKLFLTVAVVAACFIVINATAYRDLNSLETNQAWKRDMWKLRTGKRDAIWKLRSGKREMGDFWKLRSGKRSSAIFDDYEIDDEDFKNDFTMQEPEEKRDQSWKLRTGKRNQISLENLWHLRAGK